MKWKALCISLVAVVVLAVAGCGKKEAKAVAIDEKNDKCAVCNMSAMDNQFTTEVVLDNGKALKFDDLGCMYKWLDENKDKKLQAKFVRDYNSKEWVELDKASFVYDKSIKTPMAYNVISFKDKKEAEKFTKEKAGTLLAEKDLTSHKWERNKEMMMKMKEMKEQNGTTSHSH
ncbi:nitrous oxide reductase accessory protein NosL [Microbacteriaceae bacterium 4G12]